ncbi:MAG: MBOAT family O-acyltransferase [Flectobacillus sp.]|nr:MBOAT family O-acyltransferase [Flectobacillus sp.]
MLFNSYPFVGFLLVTLFVYYLPLARRFQLLSLILASFYFYAFLKPILLVLLLASILFNTSVSWVLERNSPKRWVTLGVIFNLLLLCFFKYASLIAKTFIDESSSSDLSSFILSIPLPIGISFYTFEGISLLVDSYRGKTSSTKVTGKTFVEHLIETTHFVSFFPHLIAGPILKAHDFYPQIKTKYLKDIDWNSAFKNVVIGFFLKMVVADNLKEYTGYMSYPYFENLSSPTLIILMLGYSCQIFADFAGYSLIAIGIAKLFGYDLPTNFNYPYISQSFSEFWQRWHISLSTWLKEYLYIPLGGNRNGNNRTYLNLFLVMLLGGLWHGAGWNYAVWGMIHGVALGLERLLITSKEGSTTWLKCLRVGMVFLIVTIAWLFFKLPNFTQALLYIQKMGTNWHLPFIPGIREVYVLIFCMAVALYHLYYLWKGERQFPKLEMILLAIMLFFIMTNSGFQGDFIYFQF